MKQKTVRSVVGLLMIALIAASCSSSQNTAETGDASTSTDTRETTTDPETSALSCTLNGEVFQLTFGENERYQDEEAAADACARLSVTTTTTTAAPGVPLETTSTIPAGSLVSLFDEVESGVLRVLSTTCESGGTGTGFLISDRHIATAAHVVAGSQSVEIEIDGIEVPASIVGIDQTTDLALLEVQNSVDGHIFDLADADRPAIGSQLIAIGFPGVGRGAKTIVSGLVSGYTTDGLLPIELVQTDTQITSGNSGGPLLTPDGEVVAMAQLWESAFVGTGAGFGATMEAAEPTLTGWIQKPASVPLAECAIDTPTADTIELVGIVEVRTEDPGATEIAEFMSTYMAAINDGDPETAWGLLAPNLQENFPLEDFARDTSTSFNFGVGLWEVSQANDSVTVGTVTFTSVQDAEFGPHGQDCSFWTLEYTIQLDTNGDLSAISGAANLGDSPEPCFSPG